MSYSSINKSTNFFDTLLYTGDGSATQSISGLNFQPDFTWIKSRVATHDHYSFDSVRTNKKGLEPSDTSAERTPTLGSFDNDGFTFASTDGFYNTNGDTYASWNWKAGTTGSGTTTGSGYGKAYSYSVNTTSGFSIVKYVGNGSSGHTIPHHLGAAPQIVLVKCLDQTYNWCMYNKHYGNGKALYLNDNTIGATSTGFWNDTHSTSSVFTLGNDNATNQNDQNYIAYVWTEKVGYSKFGKYVGNSSTDGVFIYTGFKPTFFLVKNISTTGKYWLMFDNKRDVDNPVGQRLYPAVGDVEATGNENDFLSNGIKLLTTGDFYKPIYFHYLIQMNMEEL